MLIVAEMRFMFVGSGSGAFETQANIVGFVTTLQVSRVTVHRVLVLRPFILRVFV
jgi:hypothetical protein